MLSCGFKKGMLCGQCQLIVKLNNNNFLIFLTENLPILNPYLPQKSENVRPHSSHSSRKNATPSSGKSPLASCKEVPPPPPPEEGRVEKMVPVLFNYDKIINLHTLMVIGASTFCPKTCGV